MMDYVSEMNRLFLKTSENDFQGGNIASSIYSQSPIQSMLANRSSSSADSTSPESYSDLTPFQRSASDLYPSRMSTRRPIVGRKILGNSKHSQPVQEPLAQLKAIDHDFFRSNSWNDDLTNPSSTFDQIYNQNNFRLSSGDRINVDKPNQMRSYELFPTDNPFAIQTPFRVSTPNMKPVTSTLSQTLSVSSDMMNLSPCSSRTTSSFPPRYTSPPQMSGFQSPSFSGASSSKIDEIGNSKLCTFCRKNGETPMVYKTHSLKEKIGSQNVVTCPILRSHVCSTCGATGDNAHTITYCPILRNSNNGIRLKSTTITLKNTRIKSNGKRRY